MNVIWLDLETTGLVPAEGHILEIAMVATRLPDFEIVGEWDAVVKPPGFGPAMFNAMHPNVQEMHTKSGLWGDVERQGGPLDAAVKKAAEFFHSNNGHTDKGQSPLAGANPTFDRGWLKHHAPALERLFSYRHFEVRTITQLQTWVFGVPLKDLTPQHRALDDCHDAIHYLRKFLGVARTG